MEYGSVCSGVEAAGLAWMPLGWKAKFFAEVEPFPSAVLQQRFNATKPLRPLDPCDAQDGKDRKTRESWLKQTNELPDGGEIPNLGDFTKITKEDYEGKIDLLVGGTPCQSYSLAGLRKGLADPRGNLALEFVRLAYRTDARWVVWENVPGVFSSGKGEDFAGFLSLLCGWEVPVPDGGWGKCGIVTNAPGCFGVAWRVLDTQYTRVASFPRAIPQRRRRVFLVGYRGGSVGDSPDWRYPAAVLFDGEMRERDTPPRRETRAGASPSSPCGTETAACEGVISQSLRMREGCAGGGKGPILVDELSFTLATGNDQTIMQARKMFWWDGSDKASTLTCTSGNQLMPDKKRLQCVIDMRQIEAVTDEVAPTLVATDYKGGKAVLEDDVCPTLDASYPGHINNQDIGKLVCYENHGNDSRVTECGDVAPTLTSRMGTGGNNQPLCQNVLAFIKNDAGGGQQHYDVDVFPTIRSLATPAVAFNITACDANGTRKDRPNGGLYVNETDASNTVTAGTPNTETVVIEGAAIALDGDKMCKAERKGGSGLGVNADDVMYTQTVKDVHAVAYAESGWHSTVRKLLPIETERLMGFPDNHTRIKWKGKSEEECPDAPRYKACGNSFCVNVVRWIGERIQGVEEQISHGGDDVNERN